MKKWLICILPFALLPFLSLYILYFFDAIFKSYYFYELGCLIYTWASLIIGFGIASINLFIISIRSRIIFLKKIPIYLPIIIITIILFLSIIVHAYSESRLYHNLSDFGEENHIDYTPVIKFY